MKPISTFRYPAPQPPPKGPDKPLLTFLAVIVLLSIAFAGFCVVKMVRSAPVAVSAGVAA